MTGDVGAMTTKSCDYNYPVLAWHWNMAWRTEGTFTPSLCCQQSNHNGGIEICKISEYKELLARLATYLPIVRFSNRSKQNLVLNRGTNHLFPFQSEKEEAIQSPRWSYKLPYFEVPSLEASIWLLFCYALSLKFQNKFISCAFANCYLSPRLFGENVSS